MANVFTRKTERSIGTSPTAIESYSPGSGVTSTVIGLSVANIDESNTVLVTVDHYDGANTTHLVKNAPLPSGGSLIVIGGEQKLVLLEGDNVRVTSNVASSVDAIMSILEIS